MRLYKLYTWSVVLEPLLFFTGLGVAVGIGISLARVLQIIIFLHFLALLTKLTNPVHSLRNSFFRSSLSRLKNHYWFFLFISLICSSVVLLSHLLANDPIFRIINRSGETAFLHQAHVRPFFEIIIYIYYFWYFVILPHKIFKKIEHLKYFFKVFSFVFILNLFLGYIDIIGGWASIQIIPRHLMEALMSSARFVGPRFHGLAGEPRDAFVYLVLGLAVYFLAAVVFKRKFNYVYISTILLAIILTQSASGIIGLILFVLLLFIFSAMSRHIKIQYLILLALLSSIIIIVSINTSQRVIMHLTSIKLLFENLNTGQFCENLVISPTLEGQLVNIIPMLHLLKEIMSYNFFPILFGNGIGSHSIVNSFVLSEMGWENELLNSHTQIIRLIYDFGIIGVCLFVSSMVKPIILLCDKVHRLNINTRPIVISTLLVLGCSLANRSAAPFIFLGITHVSLLILKVGNAPNTSASDLSSKSAL